MLKLHLYLDDCGCCLIQGGDSYSIASSLCFVVSILSVFFCFVLCNYIFVYHITCVWQCYNAINH